MFRLVKQSHITLKPFIPFTPFKSFIPFKSFTPFKSFKPFKPRHKLNRIFTIQDFKPRHKLLNTTINTLACAFYAAGGAASTYLYVKSGDLTWYICSMYSMYHGIYTIAKRNNMYGTIAVFGGTCIIIAPIILYIKDIC